jgi:hypothetical protein
VDNLDKAVTVACLVALGWLSNDLASMAANKQAVHETHCD